MCSDGKKKILDKKNVENIYDVKIIGVRVYESATRSNRQK
jgi:hypothetical protein